jgi:hypothetical protein
MPRTVATEAKIPIAVANYARWQGSGTGHLGDLLKAMQADIAEARRFALRS